MSKIDCSNCGRDYWPRQSWMHTEDCSWNRYNCHGDGTNRFDLRSNIVRLSNNSSLTDASNRESLTESNKVNFDKSAYQREYMRKKRAEAK